MKIAFRDSSSAPTEGGSSLYKSCPLIAAARAPSRASANRFRSVSKCAVVLLVRGFDVGYIVRHGFRIHFGMGAEDELRLGINARLDQPRGAEAIDLGTGSR